MAQDTLLESQKLAIPYSQMQQQAQQFLASSMGIGARAGVEAYQNQQQISQRGAEGRVRMLREQRQTEEIEARMRMVYGSQGLEMQNEQLRTMRIQNDAAEEAARQGPQMSPSVISSAINKIFPVEGMPGKYEMVHPSGGYTGPMTWEEASRIAAASTTKAKAPDPVDQLSALMDVYENIENSYIPDEEKEKALLDITKKIMSLVGELDQTGQVPESSFPALEDFRQAMRNRTFMRGQLLPKRDKDR